MITYKEKFLEGFSDLVNFVSLFNGFKLANNEIKLLIYRFLKGKTYKECAKLLGPTEYSKRKGISKQGVQLKMLAILKKIKKQAQKQNRLEEFKLLLQDLNKNENY
jgi:hypothetical protein